MNRLESEPLQRFLERELHGRNRIVEDGPVPGWGLKRFIMLARPFSGGGYLDEKTLVFREVNDPHYWKSEVEDPSTQEVIACCFD